MRRVGEAPALLHLLAGHRLAGLAVDDVSGK
jgi:hypothetical protein